MMEANLVERQLYGVGGEETAQFASDAIEIYCG